MKCRAGTSSNKATLSCMWISQFIASDYKAGCQPWKGLTVAHDPCAQDGGRAAARSERKPQFIDLAKAIVPAMHGVIRSGSGLLESGSQHVRVGQRDPQYRLKHARLVLAVAVKRIERVILKLCPEVCSVTVGKFHGKMESAWGARGNRQFAA